MTADSPPAPDLALLEATHVFPGPYRMKIIGAAAEDFEGRVLTVVRDALDPGSTVAHSTRATPGGRHAAISLVLEVQTAAEVRGIYARAQQVEGVLWIF